MKHENIKQLKKRIKKLEEENEFLQKGIDTREDAHNIVYDQLNTHMALTQELTVLLIYMNAILALIKEDTTSNGRIVKRAIGKFKQELTDGFANNHLILKLNNKLDNNELNNNTNEKEI